MLSRFVVDEVIDEYRPTVEAAAGSVPETPDPRR